MTAARDLLRAAREAGAPDLPIASTLAGSDAWRAVFDDIEAAVRAAIDAIDDDEEAAALTGADGADALRGHRLGQLSERCVEAVTVDGLYEEPASGIVPLWRALCAAAGDAALDDVLDGADPSDGLDDPVNDATVVANDERELDEARFEPPVDAMWAPVERVIIACVDANLEHRFGHPVEY